MTVIRRGILLEVILPVFFEHRGLFHMERPWKSRIGHKAPPQARQSAHMIELRKRYHRMWHADSGVGVSREKRSKLMSKSLYEVPPELLLGDEPLLEDDGVLAAEPLDPCRVGARVGRKQEQRSGQHADEVTKCVCVCVERDVY